VDPLTHAETTMLADGRLDAIRARDAQGGGLAICASFSRAARTRERYEPMRLTSTRQS
jgi:hypothetical protein